MDHASRHVLEMHQISKAFPGVQALDGASLSIERGHVHGLVGENGAGKSTIIKVLAGVYPRDEGDVRIDGVAFDDLTPRQVHAAGVRFIHQELHLVPHFTVAESVFMGQELSGWAGLSGRRMRRRAEAFLDESLNAQLSGQTLIRDLGVAERKLVQVARALIDDQARLVVFDEPTAPLASGEIEQVFKAIRRLREQGIAMIYVSHYLGEITELCDRVTVFRNGVDVAEVDDINSESADVIIKHMVGRDIDALYPDKTHEVLAEPVFETRSLGDGQRFDNISLTLNRGEILGIAGLIGSGREELIDTIYGIRRCRSGSMTFNGQDIAIHSPADAVRHGIVLVPRDRRHDGLVLDMSVADNVNLASLDDVAWASLERRGKARARADALAEDLDIRPRNTRAISRFLSGGNQQKVVLARWLATPSQLFILDEPTVGVDIGAKVEIYRLIESLVNQGASVIISSSDPAELLGLCDRVVVMMRGRLIANAPVSELSIDTLLALTTGGTSATSTADATTGQSSGQVSSLASGIGSGQSSDHNSGHGTGGGT